MPWNAIGSNLNTYGDAGNFETDRSTWGFGDSAWFALTRSSLEASLGNYCCKADFIGSADILDTNYYSIRGFVPAGQLQIDKYYRVRAKVNVEVSNVPFNNTAVIKFEHTFPNFDSYAPITKTILEATDNWVTVELILRATATNASGTTFHLFVQTVNPGDAKAAGVLYVDEFTIYEVEFEADPTCDLAIDIGSTVVTDETTAGANDGTITVATTGGTAPLEYSKNGVDWQASNQFTGLPPAVYTIDVRDSSAPQCTAQQAFSVNASGISFDFTLNVTNETSLGQSDGSIEVTVTGTGGPFTFSKDAGTIYQASNIFSGLTPDPYIIVVKDSFDNTKSELVIIEPGAAAFENVYFDRDPVPYSRYATGNQVEDNYEIFLDVRVEDTPGSGVFVSKLKTSKPPVGGQADFNLRQAFRGVLSATPPVRNENNLLQLTDRVKKFKVYFGDIYDDLTEPAALSGSNPMMVMIGGLSKFKYPSIDYFYNYLSVNKKFMTWAPLTKLVDANQEDYLQFWVYLDTVTTVRLYVKAYYDDDTNESAEITSRTVSYGDMILVPAGPLNSAAIGINPAKNMTKYDLWLADQASAVISEVRTYRLTSFQHPRTRYLMFLNSLGAYEVLRFTGKMEQSGNFDREIFEKFLESGYDPLEGQYLASNVRKTNNFSMSSGLIAGPLSREWLDYMQDFMLSTKIFDITDGDRLPLINTTKSAVFFQNDDNKRYVRVDLQNAYSDHSYTPLDT